MGDSTNFVTLVLVRSDANISGNADGIEKLITKPIYISRGVIYGTLDGCTLSLARWFTMFAAGLDSQSLGTVWRC